MKPFPSICVLGIAMTCASLTVVAGPPALGIGDPAPAFELPGSDGETHTLDDLHDKQVVVLAWFPKAFTGG